MSASFGCIDAVALATPPFAVSSPIDSESGVRSVIGMPAGAMSPLRLRPSTPASPDILSMGDWLKVVRVYAKANAAKMVEFQPCWDCSDAELIGPAMRPAILAILAEHSVALSVRLAFPEPARRGEIHLAPKPLGAMHQSRFYALILAALVVLLLVVLWPAERPLRGFQWQV